MIKTILFDLDGTLLNTIDDLADAGNWVCTQHGWPTFTVEQFKHMVGNGIPKLVERFSPENARTPEQLAATLAEFTARYDAHKEDKTAPYPGIPELLDQLQAAGIDDITVVVGYMKEKLFYLEDRFHVKIVINEDYTATTTPPRSCSSATG